MSDTIEYLAAGTIAFLVLVLYWMAGAVLAAHPNDPAKVSTPLHMELMWAGVVLVGTIILVVGIYLVGMLILDGIPYAINRAQERLKAW